MVDWRRRGQRTDSGSDFSSTSEATAPGSTSAVVRRYPALARALAQTGERSEGPTIHDAATAAVEHKDAGQAVDAGVAGAVGAHLGADFSGVRVHHDPLAQEATAAMGARAFAYGGDVFLGANESGGDLGLMAHELTHVAQQGAAGQRAPQRQVEVGASDSPAEREADQVASAVTGCGKPAVLLVDDGPVQPGQMLKSTFLEQLREQTAAAAAEELGPLGSVLGCPHLDQYFQQYGGQPAAATEALLKRYAPASRNAARAADLIPTVVARVREGVRAWRDTGQAPPDISAAAPDAVSSVAAAPQALRAPDGRETLASLESELGPGQPLAAGTAAQMSAALGVDVSSARIHTGPIAARKADDAGAQAFAVGGNVVIGDSAPALGTVEGDALLAHELAHTVQQQDAATDPVARRRPIGDESSAAEDHADGAAVAAVAKLHDDKSPGLMARMASRVGGALTTGLQLQRCPKKGKAPAALTTAQTAARARLAHLDTLADAAFRTDVAAMSKADTELLLNNIETTDQAKYATLISRIRDERLVSTAEGLVGSLNWAGNSGPDAGDHYQIKTKTSRPKDTDLVDGVPGNETEIRDNDFAKWVRGVGPEPTTASQMNCWEMVLFAGFKAGVIPKPWIDAAHADAATAGDAAGSSSAYMAVIEARLNLSAAATWTAGTVVPRGSMVFFNRSQHVALATGNVVGGKQEVVSLWVFPVKAGNLLNSLTQRTTIEDLVANGIVTVTEVKFGPNPWR